MRLGLLTLRYATHPNHPTDESYRKVDGSKERLQALVRGGEIGDK